MSTSKNDLFLGGLAVVLASLLLVPVVFVVIAVPALGTANYMHGLTFELALPYWEVVLLLVAAVSVVILADLYVVEA